MGQGVLIATPFSDLFADSSANDRLRFASDLLELRRFEQAYGCAGQILFHCEASVVVPWDEVVVGGLRMLIEGLRDGGGQLEGISLHVPSRYRENEIFSGAFIGKGIPMSVAEMLANAERNAALVREALPGVSLLIENNNHLGTDAYDVVTEPGFLVEILDQAQADLLLDVAHARITACNAGMGEEAYFAALPLNKVVQVHLSRHGEQGGRAVDAHGALEEEDWAYFADLVGRLPRLRYATVEYYASSDVLLAQIARLRDVLGGG